MNLKEKYSKYINDKPLDNKSNSANKYLVEELFNDKSNNDNLKKVKLLGGGKKLVISFPYNAQYLSEVKELDGRKYDAKTKTWSCPLSFENMQKLNDYGYTFNDNALRVYHQLTNIVYDSEEVKTNIKFKTPKGLKLREYQNQSLNFIEKRNGKAIISLEQGLGKTIVASTFIYNHKEIKPTIVVVPATLKYNWFNELNKWTNNKRKIEIVEGKSKIKFKKTTDILIINYDILSDHLAEIKKIKPKMVIFDECQYIKSIKNVKRTKASKSLAKVCKFVLCLSGTPANNKPAELFNIIKMVEPTLFSSFYQYGQRYCDPVYNGFGWKYDGLTNGEELFNILNNIMIRYKKSDVLKELPNKQYTFIPLELDNRKDYTKAETDLVEYIRQTKGNASARKAKYAETLIKMSTLRQLAVKGALKNSIKFIEDKIESTDEKFVVFAIHKEIINTLRDKFKDICVVIDGNTKNKDRQIAVEEFQTNKKIKIFIGNIQSAGVGLTLTASNNVIFLELPWSKSETDQCVDRVHRLGQTKNSVNVYYCLPINTIEYKLAEMIDKKGNMLSEVMDGKKIKETDMITSLMKEYEK